MPLRHPQTKTAETWLRQLESALADQDAGRAVSQFHTAGHWRDLLAFTWDIKTASGVEAIHEQLRATTANTDACEFILEEVSDYDDNTLQLWFRFATAAGRAIGIARLCDGRCWTLLTALRSLHGFEEACGENDNRERGVEPGIQRGRMSWLESREQTARSLGIDEQPYCLIIGGGQGGIALAARLKRLNVPTLVIDKHPRAGDAWRNRYRTLCLHDPVWYDHMPYIPFPDHWPVYSPKDKIGDWLEMYTRVMELDYWTSTECLNAEYIDSESKWRVAVECNGEQRILQPSQLVLATGMSGVPIIPDIPGMENFQGAVMHSSEFKDGAEWKGKQCVVVGSGNSAHDICAELWEQGADVTMVQRSSSLVVKIDTLAKGKIRSLFSDEAIRNGITTDKADLLLAATPYAVMPEQQRKEYEAIHAREKDFYDALGKAGFNYDFGDDGSGLYQKYLRYGAGYYIDVGASQLIIDGEIKIRSGESISAFTHDSLVLSDGSELKADLVVLSTGYGSMHGWAAQLISQEVADKVGPCWGLGSATYRDPGPWQGELRNMWKPTAQDGLWFHGGNLQQSRHYSLYLALQIKARLAGKV